MPYYDYECSKCEQTTEIDKSISAYDREEQCQQCNEPMKRLISAGYFLYEKVEEAQFNPGLGQVVRNRKHKNEILRKNGLIECGNDKPPADKPNHIEYEI